MGRMIAYRIQEEAPPAPLPSAPGSPQDAGEL